MSALPLAAAAAAVPAVPLRGRSVQARLLQLVVGCAVAFAAVAGALAYRIGHLQSEGRAQDTIRELARAVEKTAAIGAYAGDEVLMREVLQGLAGHPLLAEVEVRSPANELVLSFGQAEHARGGPALVHVLPAPFDGAGSPGKLVLRAHGVQIASDARRQASMLALLMAAQAALLSAVLYGAVARRISRPIVRLAGALQRMAPGSAERLAAPPGHAGSEIGTLVGGANQLLQATDEAFQRERRLRAEIEAMEAQYRQIFDSTSAGIFVLDGDGRLINGNPTVLKVIGADVRQVQQLRGEDFIRRAFAHPERVRELLAEAQARGETVSADLELRDAGDGARGVRCLISVQGEPPAPRIVEGVMYDITERKRAEHAVQHQAEHDALTGLKNRAASDATVDRFIAAAQAGGRPVALLYIDLDGFKQVNDRLGHKAGDQVLRAVARRIGGVVRRSSDLAGRIGGDEFVVALDNCGPADETLTATARALVDVLREPVPLDGGDEARIGASVGIACFPRHGGTRRALAHAADEAMYEVKRSGRNAYAMALPPAPG